MKNYFYLIALALYSCNNSEQTTKVAETIAVSDYPNFETQGDILLAGTYHGDEINTDELTTKKWLSIQYGQIKWDYPEFERVKDPIVDGDFETTGVKVSIFSVTDNDSGAGFLFSNDELFSKTNEGYEGYPVETIKFPEVIEPRKPHSFTFKRKQYKLSATGTEGPLGYENYVLTLSMQKGGETVNQILVAQSASDNDKVNILFAGDIDNDGVLDLVIDTSNHYNVKVPTLYLSSLSKSKNLILKIAAFRKSVGC